MGIPRDSVIGSSQVSFRNLFHHYGVLPQIFFSISGVPVDGFSWDQRLRPGILTGFTLGCLQGFLPSYLQHFFFIEITPGIPSMISLNSFRNFFTGFSPGSFHRSIPSFFQGFILGFLSRFLQNFLNGFLQASFRNFFRDFFRDSFKDPSRDASADISRHSFRHYPDIHLGILSENYSKISLLIFHGFLLESAPMILSGFFLPKLFQEILLGCIYISKGCIVTAF